MRNELGKEGETFSILLAKVLYSGAHAGDYLSLEDVNAARSELERLENFVCSSEEHLADVESFRRQMIELTEMALRVAKPISFQALARNKRLQAQIKQLFYFSDCRRVTHAEH